jgi:hypothetical protein
VRRLLNFISQNADNAWRLDAVASED